MSHINTGMQPLDPFNLFPLELEDQIFEYAARMHLTYAPTLALVSKHVQWVVEFVIYETIVLSNQGPYVSLVCKFEPTLRSRAPEFFARHVRNLCLTNDVSTPFAGFILSICTGIHHLAMWQANIMEVGDETWRFILPLAPGLCSLDTDRRTMQHLMASGTAFPCLERLCILRWPFDMKIPPLHCQWLPALTFVHLDFSEGNWQDDIGTALSSAPLLHHLELEWAFQFQGHHRPEAFAFLEIGDDRVFLRGSARDQRSDRELERDDIGLWQDFCGVFRTRPPTRPENSDKITSFAAFKAALRRLGGIRDTTSQTK